MDEDIANASIVKLVIQPILENAIEYGVSSMDDEGKILVRGYRKNDEIFIEVKDNGIGMPEEVSNRLLTEENHVQTRGSGVGLINVHKRIQLRFGEEYGLRIESEPDRGTTVVIHLPYKEMGGEASGK
jgi:two-component system sensor histidine kinase YesM